MNSTRLGDDSGQSMVELLLMLPVIIGMIAILLKMNSAINTSIVNQKYARMMTFRLNANSAIYPVLQEGADFADFFAQPGGRFFNRMVIGVAEQPIGLTQDKPLAQTQLVARTPELSRGPGENQAEPVERGLVRIRTTVEICTQSNYVNDGGTKRPLGEAVMKENMVLDFCATPERGNG